MWKKRDFTTEAYETKEYSVRIKWSKLMFSEPGQKIRDKSARVGIVGLGYVGLPLAVAFCESGFRVSGFDIQQKRVNSVNQSKSYIADVSDARLSSALANNLLEATTKQSRLKEMDAICICVPTPLTKTKEPDLSYVIYESEELSKYLRRGQLVVLESTTYPCTTREVMLPILERSGLKGSSDFYLAFSPERVDPGSKNYNIKNTPKIVGGIDPYSTEIATLLYHQVAEVVVPVSCPEVAEMTKIFENVFRGVNIALVNELAQLCQRMNISVWEVIDAASTKPFGYMPFYPGPGVGGHCIPLDPYYLANKAREYDFHTRFIELAAEINERMPYYVVLCIMEALNAQGKSLNGASVLVLGAAYKKDVGDIRESPSLKLLQLLQEKGAELSYNDPYVSNIQLPQDKLSSVTLTKEILSLADCVIIATDHSCYNLEQIVTEAKLVFDARGVTRGLKQKNIVRLGE
jgi:UDP-N-acetyl-D-glucosamine dehydrogenase